MVHRLRDRRGRCPAELPGAAATGDTDRGAMANHLERQALDVLARHPDGCAEAVLLADGFTLDLLSGLVIDGYATLERKDALLWMRITEAGRRRWGV